MTYTADPNPNLAIPDDNPFGVVHTLSITDDFEIADLDFRADSVTHTFPDDLMLMLKSPGGFGTDVIAFIGFNDPLAGGGGNNVTNMLVDDDLPFTLANDMMTATTAPYTGSWIPVYNSPTWSNPAVFGANPDPVGTLTRYDGLSTQGVWQLLTADEFPADTGTLNAWSLVITPTHFNCVVVPVELLDFEIE